MGRATALVGLAERTRRDMGNLGLSGINSGIDTDTIVASLMQIEAAPLGRLSTSKASYQAKQAALKDVSNGLADLRGTLSSLRDAAALRKVTVASSDTSVVTAASAGGATEGNHQITVNRLATAEREVHAGVAARDTALGGGYFAYTYDGQTRSLLVGADSTLSDVVNQINNDTSNPGVTASILEYEVPGNPQQRYHMVLSGNNSGADYAITVAGSTTLAAFGPGAGWTQTQTATNSQFRIDGYPDGGWIERSGNSVTDVISGVSLSMVKTGSANISLTRSTADVTSGLQGVVAKYNAAVLKVKQYTGYNPETKTAGALRGDSGVLALLEGARTALVGSLSGFDSATDTYTQASQLGIEIQKDGTLKLDTVKLSEALTNNYQSVLNVIGARRSGGSSSDFIQFTSAEDATAAGVYEVQVQFDAAGVITGTPKMRVKGSSAWEDATVSGNVIVGRSGTAGQHLQVTAIWDGVSSTQVAEVRVQKGFAGVIYDSLDRILDKDAGAVKVKNDQYDEALTQLDKRIDAAATRLEAKELQLREKFARLEATLARLDSQKGSFEALFKSLEANKSS